MVIERNKIIIYIYQSFKSRGDRGRNNDLKDYE